MQVDINGCIDDQYCSEVGRAEYSPVAVVTETGYTAQLIGDNLFRWRVWAINEDGTPGDFSAWRTFTVRTPAAW